MEKIANVLAFFMLVLVVSINAQTAIASDREHEQPPTDTQGPAVLYKSGDNTEATAKGLGLGALLTCAGISLYQGLNNGRWYWPYEWCLGLVPDPQPAQVFDPPPAPEPQTKQADGLLLEINR